MKRKHVTTQSVPPPLPAGPLRFLLLALGRAREAAKEARSFFLEVDLQILVIIQRCGDHLALFTRLGRRRLISVQALRDKCHYMTLKNN